MGSVEGVQVWIITLFYIYYIHIFVCLKQNLTQTKNLEKCLEGFYACLLKLFFI